jgi:hypothetical protein
VGAERSPEKDKKKDDGCLYLFLVRTKCHFIRIRRTVPECYLAHWFEVGMSEMEKRNGTSFLLHVYVLEARYNKFVGFFWYSVPCG